MTRRKSVRPAVVPLIGALLCCRVLAADPAPPDTAASLANDSLTPDRPVQIDLPPAVAGSAPIVTPDPTAVPLPPPPQETLLLGAAPGRPAPPPGAARVPDTGSASWLLQTVCALAVVIALIYALRVVLQRLAGQSPIGPASRAVEVLSRTSVAPKTVVLLLKVNQTVLVVGQSPSGLSTLATFNDPADVAQLLAAVSASKPLSISESFRHILTGADRDYDAPRADAGDDAEPFVDRARDEVGGLRARIKGLRGKESA